MVPFTSVSIVDGMWRFTWGNGWGVVRVVLWGVLIEETEETEFFYPASSMHASLITAPPIEVVPGGDYRGLLWSDGIELLFDGVSLTWFNPVPQTAISERNLPYIRLQWYRVPCSHYVIEVNNNGTWQLHSTRSDTPDIFIQTFITQILEDQVEWLWRVTALDENKRESSPLTLSRLVVRPPDVPVDLGLNCTLGVLSVASVA